MKRTGHHHLPDPPSAPAAGAPPRVADVMRREVVVVPAWVAVDVSTFGPGPARGLYPVVDVRGAPVGLLDSATLPDGPARPAGEVCIPLRGLRTLSPDDSAAVPETGFDGRLPALVVHDGLLVGVVLPVRRRPR